MKPDHKKIFLTAIAVGTGLIVLAGYFFRFNAFQLLRNTLVNWAVILAGVALWIGIGNLARVHWGRIKKRNSGWGYSSVLLISLLVTLAVSAYFGPTAAPSMWIYNHIQIPLETSMLALLCVILVFALTRLFNRKFDAYTTLFLATIILVILGTISLPGVEFSTLRGIRSWVAQIWAGAGSRGILFGIALGTVAAGIRVLLGVDRPYNG